MTEIMYKRDVKQGTFKIESALALFKEFFSELLLSEWNEQLINNKIYATVYLRYSFETHAYYLVTATREFDNEILTHKKDTESNNESYFIGEWIITQNEMRQFSKDNRIAQSVALAIQNVQISKNDTQITALTNAQKNAIFEELINNIFDEVFHPQGKEPLEENKDAAYIELNHNPEIQNIVNELAAARIGLNDARNLISQKIPEHELQAYIFKILDDNITVIQNIANKNDNNPNP